MKRVVASLLAVALCSPAALMGVAYADNAGAGDVVDRDEASFDAEDAEALIREIEQAPEGEVSTDSLIVTLKEGGSSLSAMSAEEGSGSSDSEVLSVTDEGSSVVEMRLPEDASMSDAVRSLATDDAVESVQPNYTYQLIDGLPAEEGLPFREGSSLEPYSSAFETNDPYARNTSYSSGGTINEWYLDSINAKSGWSVSRCDGGVTVVVMDTGVNFNHSDLEGVLDTSNARQFYYSSRSSRSIVSAPYATSETRADYAHGTHVAGIVAAEAGNAFQFAGVSHNAKVLPIKIFFDHVVDGKLKVITNDALLIKAYEYVFGLVDSGRSDIRVINLSLGGDAVDSALEGMINKAKDQYGILTVCASGNSNTSATTYPADFAACTAVTSVTNTDAKAAFSNYGAAKDIAAPGTYIWSTYTGSPNAAHVQSGTSMSSPMVSAAAALLWAYDPTLTVDEVQDLMYSTASPIKTSVPMGCGKLNIGAALDKLASGYHAGKVAVKDSVKRVSQGTDASDTAAAVSQSTFDRSSFAVLARNDDFADSMSATGLAGVLDAPILLTSQSYLSHSTLSELKRLGVRTVYLIGGEVALPAASIEPGLRAAGVTDIRRVAGSSASDTSLECAEAIASLKQNPSEPLDKIIVATPTTFEDAISMSSFAYAYRVPILLQSDGANVHERSLSDEAKGFVSSHGRNATVFVPGGVNAVSWESAEGTFGKRVVRLTEGTTAYDTSNYIANYMVDHGYLDPSVVTVACGASGAKGLDGLAGGALAGRSNGVMLLMNGNPALGPVDNTVVDGFIAERGSQITGVNAIGGQYVMPDSSLARISSALG